MLTDTLPKHGNEMPNTDEPERICAVLVAQVQHGLVVAAKLKPLWYVDFYKREEKR